MLGYSITADTTTAGVADGEPAKAKTGYLLNVIPKWANYKCVTQTQKRGVLSLTDIPLANSVQQRHYFSP